MSPASLPTAAGAARAGLWLLVAIAAAAEGRGAAAVAAVQDQALLEKLMRLAAVGQAVGRARGPGGAGLLEEAAALDRQLRGDAAVRHGAALDMRQVQGLAAAVAATQSVATAGRNGILLDMDDLHALQGGHLPLDADPKASRWAGSDPPAAPGGCPSTADCDCGWAAQGCAADDGSPCWRTCCLCQPVCPSTARCNCDWNVQGCPPDTGSSCWAECCGCYTKEPEPPTALEGPWLHRLWPSASVPYCFASDVSRFARGIFRTAAEQVSAAVPCISFSELPAAALNSSEPSGYRSGSYCSQHPAILVTAAAGGGCWSPIGLADRRGDQVLNLEEPGCTSVGAVLHVLGRALGMEPEQKRDDRGEHVKVLWDRILPGEAHNFGRTGFADTRLPYDRDSVMHYSARAFSASGKATLAAAGGGLLGSQMFQLSPGDAKRLAMMYATEAQGDCGPAPTDGVSCLDTPHEGRDVCEAAEADGCGVQGPADLRSLCCSCGGGTWVQCRKGRACPGQHRDRLPEPPSPESSSTVAIRTFHGSFVTAAPEGALTADARTVNDWEKFTKYVNSDGSLYLKTFHGKYVAAELDGSLRADRPAASDWETFAQVRHDDGSVSLRSFHGKYLSADPRGLLRADRDEAGDWERLQIGPPSTKLQVLAGSLPPGAAPLLGAGGLQPAALAAVAAASCVCGLAALWAAGRRGLPQRTVRARRIPGESAALLAPQRQDLEPGVGAQSPLA